MYVLEEDSSDLAPWIEKEIDLAREVAIGSRGLAVRRIQEWLTLRGYPLVIDNRYGAATTELVARFQADFFIEDTGRVNKETYTQLVEPMRETLQQQLNMSIPFSEALLEYARAHLAQHPREIGGQNRGPWVRMYMKGRDGTASAWCAGFVTFVMRQAEESLQIDRPLRGSFSCDSLVAQARAAGLFVSEDEARDRDIPPGSLFLVRRTSTDWTHVGIVEEAHELYFDTIEGNTNDDGNREGYEVCARSRSYTKKDFVVFKQ